MLPKVVGLLLANENAMIVDFVFGSGSGFVSLFVSVEKGNERIRHEYRAAKRLYLTVPQTNCQEGLMKFLPFRQQS